jgi:hypothetical protein
MEDIQYHIKSDTEAVLSQMFSEILLKITKMFQPTDGSDKASLSLTLINIYIDIKNIGKT